MRDLGRLILGGLSSPSFWIGWWVCAAAIVSIGASPPEVVKIRVPSAKISTWFPPGSDLQILPIDRFDELVKAARDRPLSPQGARVLKARHTARWNAGLLVGRSELIVESSADGNHSLVVLEPWSPALNAQGAGAKLFRATPDGKLGFKVEPNGPPSVEPEWTLRSRPGSEGRAFALALPDFEVSTLVLDLPAGLIPENIAGPRIGPEPGPSQGRALWRFESAPGQDRSATSRSLR